MTASSSRYEQSSKSGQKIANMASFTTPRSILKKKSYPAASASREEHNRELALYHANLIQERKEIELQILLNTETLIDYPLDPKNYDASNPSPSDARNFKDLIRSFQPSDYDALIVERNINEHCGYALCQNNRVKDGSGGKYRLVGKYGRAKDFRVVDKEELEKWCSESCAKRALYVRVQLSESPAWEREFTHGEDIQLLDEPNSEEDQIVDGIDKMKLDVPEEQNKKQNAADLALERGDKGYAAKNGLVDVAIKEKDVTAPAEAPSLGTDDLSSRLDTLHLTLEGHTAVFGSERQRRHHEELEDIKDKMDEDNVDTDWKI